MMETLLKILCGNNGSIEYDRLLDLSYGLTELSDLDQIIRSCQIFSVVQHSDSKEVVAKTDVKLCRKSECDALCPHLHMCKYQLMTGHCHRRVCVFGHQLMSEHNMRILRDHQMFALSRDELCVVLLQSDSHILPPVCVLYNKGGGPYGKCPEKDQCTRLHLCESFIRGRCDVTDCNRSHDFHGRHAVRILRRRGVPDHLMSSLPFIYRNILTLKSYSNTRPQSDLRSKRQPVRQKRNAGSDICLSFVKGFCKNRECSRIHFNMPYKWEVKVSHTWTDLDNNEEIERDYCDPSNIYSSGNEPVCFEDMTLGLDEVRRLSTEPSVLLPSFVLTTTWVWYWRDEYSNWIQFASVKEMHRLSTVGSEDLEKRYQQYLQLKDPLDQDAVVKFRAGNRFYQLNFKDMIQRNEVSGTERPIRRRPVFVSSLDVHTTRTSRKSLSFKPLASKNVPGFWDQSAIPDCGFERVRLQPSHRDYMRVQDLFGQTMSSFTIRQIERVQNRELWEIYIIKKEELRKANKERFGERLVFHGIKSSLLDVVCRQNFDIEMSDTTVYGKGIYFSKDAQSCSNQTDECEVRLMFVCRVLLGHYTRGDARFHHPPPKNAAGDQYNSCVDNPRDPSVFVLFDRSQIYPEFLVTYEQNKTFEVSEVQSRTDTHVTSLTREAHVNVKDVSQTETSDVRQNSYLISTQTSASYRCSRETDSRSAVSRSKLDTNPGVSDVPKPDLNSVLMTKTAAVPPTAVLLHAGKLSGDSELKHISAKCVKPLSGKIQEVSQVSSASVDFQLDSLSADVQQYSSNTVQLDMSSPPVPVNSVSVSGGVDVSSSQSFSRSSKSVSISSAVSSRQTVGPQHHRENSSAMRQARRPQVTVTTKQEKKCTIM